MQSIKMRSMGRNLIDIAALGAMAVAFALAWGNPFVGDARAQDQAQKQEQQKSGTFTGQIAKQGDQYVLHDSSGETFKLDDAESARPYVGKTVKVTGQLDEQAKLIHVETIVTAS